MRTNGTMLEKPDLPDEKIIACLRDGYGLRAAQIAFLPLGNDVDTAVYRVDAVLPEVAERRLR